MTALAVAVVVVAGGVAAAVAASGGSRSPGGSSVAGAPERGARADSGSRGVSTASVAPRTGASAAGDSNIKRLIALGLPIYCAGPNGNAVAFTFDDGPGPYTHYAVKKLTEAGERGTFFVVGRSMDNFPGWLPRELKVGAIGDHTATHPELTALSSDEVRSQLATTKQKIETDSGQPVELWRPPYGARNSTIDQIGQSLGMLEILWSTDSADSLGAEWDGIIRNVEAGLRPGAIILMHENRGQTIRALTTLLPELQRRHLRSVSLPELFATDPPSVSQVRQGPNGCSGGVKAHGTGG
ncbi:MAG TPA: polysaccharide deacetylase family protein [Solirubrobacteraceae bacterium]|nr:polysaccharide deacetylase family protein [Solirubrobacteraceae bacterium]